MEIETSQMELDGLAKAVAIAESTRGSLDALNAAVDGFTAGVRDASDDGVDHAFEMGFFAFSCE